MSALEYTARIKLASLLDYLRRLWGRSKTFRFVVLSLAANVVGYTLVYILSSKGGLNKWWANESVSKGMAPAGLALNTLALTGQFRPTVGQAAKWTTWWVPSAIAGAICTGVVVSSFELGTLECRMVAGACMFPVDYGVKRFIIYYHTSLKEKKEAQNRFESGKTTSSEHVMRWRTGSA